jgi:prepilin-type N-terminal cleavage/methylation domain-containing protein
MAINTSGISADPSPVGLSSRRARRYSADDGLSLVEVMVALVVLALFATAAAAALSAALTGSRRNTDKVQASNLATRQIEIIRNMTAVSVPDGLSYGTAAGGVSTTPTTITLDKTVYTVTNSAEYVPANNVGGSCTVAAGSRIAYKRISVAVTWTNMGSAQPVREDTLMRIPVTGLDNTTGQLSVPVQDATGAPVSGATVTASGAKVVSALTDDDGCAVLVGMPAGSYTVTASMSGRVNWAGSSAPTTAATVVAATMQPVSSFILDKGAAIQVGLTTPSSNAYTPVNALPITARNHPDGGQFAAKQYRPCSATNKIVGFCYPDANGTFSRTIGSPLNASAPTSVGMFPFVAGYDVWAGDCTDNLPASPAIVNTQPGVTGAVTLALGGVSVTNKGAAASELYAWDSTCSGEFLDLGRVSAGATAKIGLPYGAWRIQSDNVTTGAPATGKTWPSVTLTATNQTATALVTP